MIEPLSTPSLHYSLLARFKTTETSSWSNLRIYATPLTLACANHVGNQLSSQGTELTFTSTKNGLVCHASVYLLQEPIPHLTLLTVQSNQDHASKEPVSSCQHLRGLGKASCNLKKLRGLLITCSTICFPIKAINTKTPHL